MRQWRLIYDSPSTGVYNMGVDKALLSLGDGTPALRFYAWSPPCLSLGYGQKAADVDFERAAAAGWDVVRRPTGGRAILHVDELTYSLALPLDHPIAAGGIVESYQRISQALMLGLSHLGVDTQSEHHNGRSSAGPVCFETPSHYEITVRGRKLIGSAQVRRKNYLLQHGSLPLYGDITRICDVLAYSDEIKRQQAQDQIRTRAITLSEALNNQEISWQMVAEALIAGFQEAFKVDLQPTELSRVQREYAAQMAADIYSKLAWTFRR